MKFFLHILLINLLIYGGKEDKIQHPPLHIGQTAGRFFLRRWKMSLKLLGNHINQSYRLLAAAGTCFRLRLHKLHLPVGVRTEWLPENSSLPNNRKSILIP